MNISDYWAATLKLNEFIAESEKYRANVQYQIAKIRLSRIESMKNELEASIKNFAKSLANATPSVVEFSDAIAEHRIEKQLLTTLEEMDYAKFIRLIRSRLTL